MSEPRTPQRAAHGSRRMPKNSTFYDKVIPILLIGFALLTAALILFAVGVLFGIVTWR